jgi:hypothetical protein
MVLIFNKKVYLEEQIRLHWHKADRIQASNAQSALLNLIKRKYINVYIVLEIVVKPAVLNKDMILLKNEEGFAANAS